MRHAPAVFCAAAALFVAVLCPAASFGAATFEVLGRFGPVGVSDDGNTVAGTGSDPGAPGQVMVLWTPAGGLRTAGWSEGHEHTSAHGISGDGSTILGVDYNAQMLTWTAAAGIQYPPGTGGYPGAISRDASVIVGGDGAPFRWTAAGGRQPLPMPPGWTADGRANAVSADGSVVAGTVFNDPGGQRPFRWTAGGGTVLLDGFDGAAGQVDSMSADGSTIAGWAWRDESMDAEAWRWTASGGVEWAGHVPGQRPSPPSPNVPAVLGLSADGSVAVGRDIIGPNGTSVAFYWERGQSIRRLDDVLRSDYGLDLTGWELGSAVDITPDGAVIVGSGSHPEFGNVAWRVVLPEPGASAALLFASCLCLRRRRA